MPALTPGSPAPAGYARDASGQTVDLASLWRGRAVLLVFLRHFG